MESTGNERIALRDFFTQLSVALQPSTGRAEKSPTTPGSGFWSVVLTPVRSLKDTLRAPPSQASEEDKNRFAQMQNLPLASRFFTLLLRQGHEAVRDFVIGFDHADDKVAFIRENYMPLWVACQIQAPLTDRVVTRRDLLKGASALVAGGAAVKAVDHIGGAFEARAKQYANREDPPSSDPGKDDDIARATTGHVIAGGMWAGAAGASLYLYHQEMQGAAEQKLPALAGELGSALSNVFGESAHGLQQAYEANAANLLEEQERYGEFMSQARERLTALMQEESLNTLNRPELMALMMLHTLDLSGGKAGVLNFLRRAPAQPHMMDGFARAALTIAQEGADRILDPKKAGEPSLSLKISLGALVAPETPLSRRQIHALSRGDGAGYSDDELLSLTRILATLEALLEKTPSVAAGRGR